MLYIALAVQGDAYEPFLRAALATPGLRPGEQQPLRMFIRFSALVLGALFVIFGPVFAEIAAIYVLYNHRTSFGPVHNAGLSLAIVTILLVVAVATGPVLKVYKFIDAYSR